jgi:hypothetical protein
MTNTKHREQGWTATGNDRDEKRGHREIAFIVYLMTHGKRVRALAQ